MKYLPLLLLCCLSLSCVQQTASRSSQVESSPLTATRPSLKRLPNGHYRLVQDWPIRVSGRLFTVQQGYTSNGITAPDSLKSLMGDSVDSPETWAAVFHDWTFTQDYLTRQQCDNYFIQLMRDYQISPTKIQLMGSAVKLYTINKERGQ